MTHMRRSVATVLVAACALLPRGAQSQETPSPRSRAPYFSGTDAAVGLALAATTIALFPLDQRIAASLQGRSVQDNGFLRGSSTVSELLAIPGAYVITGGLYIAGRVQHNNSLMDVAVHTTEGMLAAGAVAELVKGVSGRARPNFTADTNAHDFKLGAGFVGEDRSSLPSLHTSTAFAAAAAVSSELSGRNPKAAWIVSPLLYAAATMSGVSRLYHDKHWASDVAAGATIGTFSGLTAVRYAHNHPHNGIDRLLLHVSIAPLGGGGAVAMWSSNRE